MCTILNTEKEIFNAYNRHLILNNKNNKNLRILDNEKDFIISNVPDRFYRNSDYHMYVLPIIEEVVVNNIEKLKQEIDSIQKASDENNFELNKCHENSTIIFNLLSIVEGNKIVFGYISKLMSAGFYIDEKIVDKNVIIHDWHVWNYLNDFLIDTTILNTSAIANSNTNAVWGKASDHIFIYPPENRKYYGVAFGIYDEYKKYVKSIFDIQC